MFVASLPAVTARIYASDEALYFSYLRSLWFDHDLSFDNEYQHIYDSGMVRTPLFRETFLESTTSTGHRVNFATIGCALLWSPFYAAADAVVRISRMSGATVPADGYSRPYIWAVCVGSAVYGFLSLILSFAVARRVVPGFAGTSSGRQLLPVLAVFIGTPLVFYMYVAPPFAHACSAFAVSAFVLTWLRVRARWSLAGCAALGALAALMTMVREQDGFYAGAPALDFLWMVAGTWRHGAGTQIAPIRKALGGALAGLVAFGVTFVPQALVYVTLNGHLGPSPLLSRKMNWIAPHALQVLFSPEHGLFIWTPVALVAIVGVILLAAWPGPSASDTRRIGVCLLTMIVLGVYVTGSVASWTVAGAFGQRRFVGLTVVFVTGLAVVVTRANRGMVRALLGIVLALCMWWNLALMIQFGAGLMDRQRLEVARNAWNAFVVVPIELPRLLYRYAFDRQSFYRSPTDR